MFNNFVFILTKVANHAQYKVEDSCTKETPSLAEIVMDVSEGSTCNLANIPSSSPMTNKKEIAVQTVLNVKTFRSVTTQTDTDISKNGNGHETKSSKQPKDRRINVLSNLDHNYSSCPPKSLQLHPEPTGIQAVDSDCDSTCSGDESSMYCPSSSNDEETKFIVFESELDKLFKFCQQCGNIIATKTKHCKGSMITVKTTCLKGHSRTWKSQPTINGTATGNILIPAAILFSANTFTHIHNFAKFLNVQFVSSSHFYKIQDKHLLPVIHNKWQSSQAEIVQQVSQVNHVDICGDGRCDCPGQSAKYGTYTMLDESTKKVIDFSVVQVTEVISSNAMEYEGCRRTLNFLLDKEVPIRCLTTDRHTTVTARMKSDHPSIKHQYDVWHLSKWVTKKLTKKAKTKKFAELMPWIQAISNHLWWCAATCGGDPDMLREKWVSVLHHIVDRKCGHPAMSRRERKSINWLKAGSPAHVALEEVVTNTKLLNDVGKLTEFHHTGELEQYHSLLLKYAPKKEHFSYNGMVARTQLAIMDHNHNVNREQAVLKKGLIKEKSDSMWFAQSNARTGWQNRLGSQSHMNM